MVRRPAKVSLDTGLILVIDGDNTLWDTNGVFEKAQRWLLRSLRRARPRDPETLSFEQLRQVDDLLIQESGCHEYDFRLLVLSLLSLQKGSTEKDSVSFALSELRGHPDSVDAKLAAKISQVFRLKLQEIPSLLPSVNHSFKKLLRLKTHYKGQLALILLSEGNETRIKPILECHFGKSEVFDVIQIVECKSVDMLRDVQIQGSKVLESESGCSQIQSQLVVVGDSIKSDIVPGNLVGAITIYIPGGYKGVEAPASDEERPRRVLSSFRQLPELVESILADPASTSALVEQGPST
jgi:putative hydrolase of the HAD superfamily